MDCVGGHGKDGAGREGVVTEGDAGPGGDDTGEAEGGGGVDAEGFVDGVVEAGGMVSGTDTLRWGRRGQDVLGQVFYGFEVRDVDSIWDCFMEFLL